MDINANNMDENNENDSVKICFLRDALYIHAKQVGEFCHSGFNRVESYSADLKLEKYEDFSARALKLINQLVHLIKCARNAKSLSRTINLEQLEAKANLLYEQLESYEYQLKKTA